MLAHEHERHHDEDPDLDLFEDLFGAEIAEARGEEVGDGGGREEPEHYARKLGFQELPEGDLGPTDRKDCEKIGAHEEFGDDHELVDILPDVIHVELGAFRVLHLPVHLPAEAGVPHHSAEEEEDRIAQDERTHGRDDEVAPGQTAGDDQEYRDQDDYLALNQDGDGDDPVTPFGIAEDERA